MAVPPGTRLGHYEVRQQIGAGGMGEVYLAHDSKLQRDVAIKVLPDQFAHDPDRLARFRREAQLLASLNHPNIATIHGLEDASGSHFLVMECVPGETLQQRIQHAGAVPIDEVLAITTQICEALEAAHEKGIIHRDLKPANVKLTPEGKVKVLDFGLAKAFAEDFSSDGPLDSNSPTVTPGASPTLPGVILGTAAYMSPEQAKGKVVDKRTDIWALGCLLYELLTGRAAFEGENATDILGAVLHKEPDWSLLPSATPPGICSLLRRCLQKAAANRSRDAGEIRLQIEEASSSREFAYPPSLSKPAPSTSRRWIVISALACVLSAAIAGFVVWRSRPSVSLPVTRTVVSLAPDETLSPANLGDVVPLAFSPDGSLMVYVAKTGSDVPRLYLRSMNGLEDRRLEGTESADQPFFSPDGQWIGFSVSNVLKKMPVAGGAVLTLCNAPGNLRGATWASNDKIIFASGTTGPLFQVSSAGGTPEPFTTLDAGTGELAHVWPQILPGGNAILFAVSTGSLQDAAIAVQRLDIGEHKVLFRGGSFPHYAASGHLVYYRAGTIMAVPFDLDRLEIRGSPSPVIEGVKSALGGSGGAEFTVAGNGSLGYVPGAPGGAVSSLVWVDRKGVATPLNTAARDFGGSSGPRLSPDGQLVAIQVNEQKGDIWIYNIARETMTRLTFEGSNQIPCWTRDGKRVVYQSNKAGPANLFWKPADGSGSDERLVPSNMNQWPGSFAPDGRTFLYTELNTKTGRDLWVLPMDGDRKPRVFLQTPYNETTARLSPDGRYVAYVSDESGRNEVYVQPFPGPGGKYQISTEGGTEIVWGQNGEIFYRSGNKMMAVQAKTQPSLDIGKPQELFEGSFPFNSGAGANYDVSPNGQRFLMLKAPEQGPPATQINVVLNWFEELKQKVPTAK